MMRLPLELAHYSKSCSISWCSRQISQYSTHANRTTATPIYDAAVIGAGPGGLTCVSNLLDRGLSKICMVDPSFTAGRINEKYREVPSNTKVGLFAQWATGTNAFADIVESAPKPNAYERLLSLDQDKGCILGDAIDVAQLLSDGLRNDARVDSVVARVDAISRHHRDVWDLAATKHGDCIRAHRVVLAHGSHPKPHDLAAHYPHLTPLDLDTCLKPSALRSAVPAGSQVGVIGSSHSAVLALKNLHDLGDVGVVNFYRSPLLYAIYKDGWILHDNTGLKGIAADWARDVLASAPSSSSSATDDRPSSSRNRLRRVDLKAATAAQERPRRTTTEKEIYDAELNECTHLVSAIGYEPNPLPRITDVDGRPLQPAFDPLTGKFFRSDRKEEDQRGRGKAEEQRGGGGGGGGYVDGLFGAGIAYPERVTDRVGNVESAVGWFKFMKFVKRVVPGWLERA